MPSRRFTYQIDRTCDCGEPSTRQVFGAAICERCYVFDGGSVAQADIIFELLGGPIHREELINTVGVPEYKFNYSIAALVRVGRVLKCEDSDGARIYRLSGSGE